MNPIPMNTQQQLLLWLLTAFLAFSACEEVIELDLPEGPRRLVVEGAITNQPGPQSVKLTYTSAYFDDQPAPVATGALVVIQDQEGTRDTLQEVPAGSGTYQTDRTGQWGHTYVLEISLPNGQQFRSEPELLQEVLPIDSMYFDENIAFTEEDEGYNILLDTRDPAGVANYYRWRQTVNGEPWQEPLDIAIGFDDFADGRELTGIQVNLRPVQLGDTVRIEQMAITRRYYDYLFTLQQQTAFVGGIFDPPPAPIKGNVLQLGAPEAPALGYFFAAGVSEIEGVVSP